jgi:DNA-binding response OmpR family regulator
VSSIHRSGQHTVIIIEDNETFSLLVTHYLKKNLEDVKVFAEHSGARAMESIKRIKPSLVVLDYFLEDDLSGKEVMTVINEMGTDRPRVILFSSIQDGEEKNEVLAMGVDLFVPKSNESFYDLVRSIESLLPAGEKKQDKPANDKGSSGTRMLITAVFLFVVLTILLLVLAFL